MAKTGLTGLASVLSSSNLVQLVFSLSSAAAAGNDPLRYRANPSNMVAKVRTTWQQLLVVRAQCLLFVFVVFSSFCHCMLLLLLKKAYHEFYL